MIWFGWNSGSTPTPVQANAVNDGFNNYDYTLFTNGSFPGWRYLFIIIIIITLPYFYFYRYHQFRINGSPRIPQVVSVKPFFDYIQNKFSLADLWFGNILYYFNTFIIYIWIIDTLLLSKVCKLVVRCGMRPLDMYFTKTWPMQLLQTEEAVVFILKCAVIEY